MKKLILSTLIVVSFVWATWAQTSSEIAAFRNSITQNKETAKSAIKSYRYDGSKITYFNYKSFEQVKEVEVYMFNRSEYMFSINTESVDQGLTLKVYDKSKNSNDRHLLKKIDNASGQQINFTSTEINKAMKEAVSNAVRLKRVYVDYVIEPNENSGNSKNPMEDRGAIVLVMGYE